MKHTIFVNILSLFLLMVSCLAFSFPANSQDLGVFDTLRSIPKDKQGIIAYKIFLNKVKKSTDSTFAFTQLNGLSTYAQQTNNKKLTIRALKFKGDYSWERIENGHDYSIEVFTEAVEKSREYGFENFEIKLSNHLGTRLLLLKRFEEGFTYVLKSDRLMNEIGYDNLTDSNMSPVLLSIGWAYAMFGNQDRAIAHYQQALKMVYDDSSTLAAIYCNLGTAYKQNEKVDSALMFYQMALDIALSREDSASLPLINANLGHVYHELGKIELARENLTASLEMNRKYDCHRCMASTLLGLGKTEMDAGNFELAKENVEKAREIIKNEHQPNDLNLWAIYYRVLGQYAQHKGDLAMATAYFDTLVNIKDSIELENKANVMANLETQLTAQKHLAELEKIQREQKEEKYVRNGIIVLLLLSFLILYLFYSRWSLNKRKNLEVALLEKEIEIKHERNELMNAKEQLVNYTNKLREKNTLIERLYQNIESKQLHNVVDHEEIMQRSSLLEKLRSANILTEDDWTEFKSVFEKVHQNFFSNILNDYPSLTIAEVRFVALTKLDLSTNEMANMLGISPDSVKRSIRRLRSKINAPSTLHFNELVKII